MFIFYVYTIYYLHCPFHSFMYYYCYYLYDFSYYYCMHLFCLYHVLFSLSFHSFTTLCISTFIIIMFFNYYYMFIFYVYTMYYFHCPFIPLPQYVSVMLLSLCFPIIITCLFCMFIPFINFIYFSFLYFHIYHFVVMKYIYIIGVYRKETGNNGDVYMFICKNRMHFIIL